MGFRAASGSSLMSHNENYVNFSSWIRNFKCEAAVVLDSIRSRPIRPRGCFFRQMTQAGVSINGVFGLRKHIRLN